MKHKWFLKYKQKKQFLLLGKIIDFQTTTTVDYQITALTVANIPTDLKKVLIPNEYRVKSCNGTTFDFFTNQIDIVAESANLTTIKMSLVKESETIIKVPKGVSF